MGTEIVSSIVFKLFALENWSHNFINTKLKIKINEYRDIMNVNKFLIAGVLKKI